MRSEEWVRREVRFWIDRAYEFGREGKGLQVWEAGYIAAALTEVLGEEAE